MDTWPLYEFWPSQGGWVLSGASVGTQSSTGMTRFNNRSGGGRWVCDMTVPLLTVEQIKLAQAMIDSLDGGSVPILVPYFNDADAPWPLGTSRPGDVPFSDGATFSDGAEFESSGISVSLSEPVALRATSIPVAIAAGNFIGGERFSALHPTKGERLYSVVRIPDANTFVIRPPWREATDAIVLNCDRPCCVMRLTNADQAMAQLTPPYLGELTLHFEEALPDANGNY